MIFSSRSIEKKIAIFSAFSSIFMGFAVSQAQAASITNLDSEPHVIVTAEEEVTIQPNETYRVQGKLRFEYNGRQIRMEEYESYAIWNAKTIGPQTREGGRMGYTFKN